MDQREYEAIIYRQVEAEIESRTGKKALPEDVKSAAGFRLAVENYNSKSADAVRDRIRKGEALMLRCSQARVVCNYYGTVTDFTLGDGDIIFVPLKWKGGTNG